MYKIGDKVETPFGVGRVDKVFDSGLMVFLGGSKLIPLKDVKPYQSAHDKLIEMGFVVVEDNVAWIAYEYKKAEYLIRFCKGSKQVGVYHDIDTNANYRYFGIELSRILTQYLEELEQ